MANAADTKTMASMVREEDLQDLDRLHTELENRVNQARTDGRVYLMQQYIRLTAIVGPEIERIRKRFKRENLAFMRKEEKRLKLELKAADNGQDTQGGTQGS